MALARTLRAAGSASGMGSGTWGPTGVSVTAGDLIIVKLGVVDNNASADISSALTAADSQTNTYTGIANVGSAANFQAQARAFRAVAGSTGSINFTFDCGANSILSSTWEIVTYTGYDAVTPTAGAQTDISAADGPYSPGTADITLTAAPIAGDYTEHWITFDGNSSGTYSFSAGSGWTAGSTVTSTTDSVAAGHQYRTGSTSTAAAWTDPDTGSMSLFAYAAMAFNVKVATDPSPLCVTALGLVGAPVMAIVDRTYGYSFPQLGQRRR